MKLPSPVPLLRYWAARLPATPLAYALCVALNRHVLPVLDTDTRALLSGYLYELNVTDIGLTVRLTVGEERFELWRGEARAPDLIVAASGPDFIRLAARDVDADTLFFSRRLIMQGSTELGLIVRNAVEAIDFEKMPGGALMQTALRRAVQVTARFA